MAYEDDPLGDDPIERDGYGRPKIIPCTKAGKPQPKGKLVPYTRASTYADAIMDAGGLLKWSLWHLALGLGRNPDLAALAGCYGPTVDDLTRSDKAEIDLVIQRAHDRSGGNAKADHGTAVHALTEPDPLGNVPDRMAADVNAYHETTRAYGLEVVDTEVFVVNDEIKAAGTYDHKVRTTRDLTFDVKGEPLTIPAGVVIILDKKTGKLHYDSQSIQLAVYANARTYDPLTGDRGEIGASTQWGILAHIPMLGGKCELHLVDLRLGWAAAKLAGKVREHRSRKDLGYPFPPTDGPTPAAPAVALADVVKIGYTVPASDEWVEEQQRVAAAFAAEIAEQVVEDKAAQGEEPTVDEFDAAAALLAEKLDAAPLRTLANKLRAAGSRDDLSALWHEHKSPDVEQWTDEHTAILRERAAEIDAKVAA